MKISKTYDITLKKKLQLNYTNDPNDPPLLCLLTLFVLKAELIVIWKLNAWPAHLAVFLDGFQFKWKETYILFGNTAPCGDDKNVCVRLKVFQWTHNPITTEFLRLHNYLWPL